MAEMKVYVVEDFADKCHWRPTNWQWDIADETSAAPGSYRAARLGLWSARKQYPNVKFRIATYTRSPSPKRRKRHAAK